MADPVTMLIVGSTMLGAAGTLAGGTAEKESAYAQAGELDVQAGEEVQAGEFEAKQREREGVATYAAGTRRAYEAKRSADVMESDARAAMAASGGVTTDPQAVEQAAKIAAEGEYEVLASLYEGETEKQGLDLQAGATRYTSGVEARRLRKQAELTRRSGKQAQKASRFKALSTVVSGGTSAYKSYKKTG